jgi:hypothetical protein
MAGGWRNPQKKMGTIYRKYRELVGQIKKLNYHPGNN